MWCLLYAAAFRPNVFASEAVQGGGGDVFSRFFADGP